MHTTRYRSLLLAAFAILFLSVKINAKTAADTASRLIANCFSQGAVNNTWVKRDSMTIAYATPYSTRYDTLHYFTSPHYFTSWYENGNSKYYYNGSNQLDSIVSYNWDGTAFVPYSRLYTQVNAFGQTTDQVEQDLKPGTTQLENFTHQTFTYNSARALTNNTWQKWNPATNSWYDIWRFVYTLNSQNKVTSDLREGFDTSLKAWISSVRLDTDYNAAGNAITATSTYNWVGTGWQGTWRYVYTNDLAGHHLISSYQGWDTGAKAWLPYGRHTYASDAAGNITNDLFETYKSASNSYDTTSNDATTYNAYNQILSHTKLLWLNGQWTISNGAANEVYYYELYSTTGIKTFGIPDLSLIVFPVPADRQLTFTLSGGKTHNYIVKLTDVQGRICSKMSLGAVKMYKGSIATDHLPAGNYQFCIQDESGNTEARKFVVIH